MQLKNSVVIPALNEAARIASVVHFASRSPRVDEVIVVDDGSVDGTPDFAAAAGARVITSTLLGKGASMEDGIRESFGDNILFLDGDLAGLNDRLIDIMLDPLESGEADFVKACFTREAGRVTTLTARPLLQVFFPELAHFTQPLGGIIAARRQLLESIRFETDYGVDLGLLIDAWAQGARIAEVSIGHLEHDSQSLERLGEMAKQVVRTLLNRAHRLNRFSLSQIQIVEEIERQTNAQLILSATEKLALFDMDGTLIQGRFVVALAAELGLEARLHSWLDNTAFSPEERSREIARLFQGVSKSTFESIARNIPLVEGAVETVVTLRKSGYRVGIVTDSYLLAAEVVRRRVFADFSIANRMVFADGLSTGKWLPSPAWTHPGGCRLHRYCKRNALEHWMDRLGIRPANILAVGDGLNDICMLEVAGQSIAFEPKHPNVASAARHTVHGDIRQILTLAAIGDK
jgi:glucosyl-3-phosphoglycerate synthase